MAENVGKRELQYTVFGNVSWGSQLIENSMAIPQNLKIDSHDLAIPLLGVYPNKTKT